MTRTVSSWSVHRSPFRAMGSACEVVLAASSVHDAQRLAHMAIDEVLRIERKYSRYTTESLIANINQQAGLRPVVCDDETWALLQYASKLHEQSQGLFDITSGVFRQAWNFQVPAIPSADELDALRAKVGWHKVVLKDQSIALPFAGMEIDLGGFGKEYAADRAAQVLQAQGVVSGYVNLAGDMRFLGPKPTGEPWMIGIQDPRHANQVVATLPITQGGLATSGDYERYFEWNGERYCHVLNPFTGRPVKFWRSVSVTAPAAVVAGCTSTMTMLKEEEGLAFLQATGFDFLAIDHAGKVH
ncbi:MAG: FAD:protein FMN transferase, partial [Betaproteobacteria bacterium]|nr:FAD:protein FMN transferase [Betaproteobacteria bacterium]